MGKNIGTNGQRLVLNLVKIKLQILKQQSKDVALNACAVCAKIAEIVADQDFLILYSILIID